MKCKNIECENETEGKRVYCSFTCRNIYVNKYLRDYSKIGESLKNNYIDKYIPNICKLEGCNSQIPYNYRENLYCSKECSKKTINSNRKELSLKYNISEETLRKFRISASLNFRNGKNIENEILKIENYYKEPNKCKGCECEMTYERRKLKFCSNECRINFRRKDMDDFKIYKADTNFKFNLGDYSQEFDFTLIEKYGWYSPSNKKDNLGGVSRDHMLSVKEGFELGIDPKLLAHPANCKLMIHNENISKHKTSSITLIELIQRIETFDKKYYSN